MGTNPIVHITAITHKGLVRDGNEDSIAVGQWVRTRTMETPHQWRFALEGPVCCIVADGMGGHAAGEVASRHAASRLGELCSGIGNAEAVENALQKINAELYDLMNRDSSLVGMGTTIVGAVMTQGGLIWFNVGDSRLYQHRNGFLRLISIDDVPEAARGRDPNVRRSSSAITQSLGGTKEIQTPTPHVDLFELTVPSRWILCSDGLSDMVDLDTMEDCLSSADLDAASRLLRSALRAGGNDNVSLIIISITREQNPL